MINIKDLDDINKLLRDYWKSLENNDSRYCYKVEVESDEDNDSYSIPYRTLEEALYTIGVFHNHEGPYIYHIHRCIEKPIGTIKLDKKDFEIVK